MIVEGSTLSRGMAMGWMQESQNGWGVFLVCKYTYIVAGIACDGIRHLWNELYDHQPFPN